MSDTATNVETVATYEHDGLTYEIDHLGICRDSQWGEYAVYQAGNQIADFVVAASWLVPEYRPPLPPTEDLIAMAVERVAAVAAPMAGGSA